MPDISQNWTVCWQSNNSQFVVKSCRFLASNLRKKTCQLFHKTKLCVDKATILNLREKVVVFYASDLKQKQASFLTKFKFVENSVTKLVKSSPRKYFPSGSSKDIFLRLFLHFFTQKVLSFLTFFLVF